MRTTTMPRLIANGGAMNGPEAVEAMTWWLSMRDIAPPESPASTWTEVGTTFGAGRAAQGLVYGENAGWIAADCGQSRLLLVKLASHCRRWLTACLPPLKQVTATLVTMTVAHSVCRIRQRTRKRQPYSCSISARTKFSLIGQLRHRV